jgi:MoaA/NifB/PqqE/SkfB family radical SAM enzyme
MEIKTLENRSHSIIINGFRAGLISQRLFLNIFLHALRNDKHPLKIIRQLITFSKKRTKIQGYSKINRYLMHEGKYHFADQIPGFPSGTFNKFFEAELIRLQGNPDKKILMNTLIFSITSRCPLKCSHCFEWDNIASQEHLQLNDLLEIMERLKVLHLTHIQFGGGEPLSRFDDLLVLINKAKQDMDCWVLTSGFGLTHEKALRMKEAGLTGVSISLDHWDEHAHNLFRNHPKAFHWVREAVINCHNAGIIINLAVCATKDFATEENILKYYELAKEWKVGFIKILEARKVGRFRGKDVTLSSGQVEMLRSFYLQSYNDKKFSGYPIVMFPGFDQRQVGCLGAGNRYMYIDSKGDLHACPFCHGSVGNVLEMPMVSAIEQLRNKGCQVFPISTF